MFITTQVKAISINVLLADHGSEDLDRAIRSFERELNKGGWEMSSGNFDTGSGTLSIGIQRK